jgi:hypothetical protein
MKSEDEIRAEFTRRISEYKLLMKTNRGYDQEADNEARIEAEACKTELESIQDFIFRK